jgi:translation elongation factor EF-1beta
MKKTPEIDTEKLVEALFEICPTDKDCGIDQIEKEFQCKISVDVEKIHALQHNYYYEVDFGLKENFFIEISSGIDTGGELISEEWDYDTKPNSRTAQVLKDIVLDMNFYEKGSFMAKKAQSVLDANKSKLFEFHRKNNYDNYVTGGHSKMRLNSLLYQLYLEYVYEEIEVDCNFV